MLGGVGLTNSWVLFTRPFWLDEWHTIFVATQPGIVESLRSLARGADFNTPLIHLGYRLIGALAGGLSPTIVRLAAFAAVWLALTIVYGLLRERLSRTSAFAGVLVIWTHTVIVRQAFEGRYYAPWLLLTALFVAAVAGAGDRPTSLRRSVTIAAAAVLLCTVHYFGIFTWLLVTLAVLLAYPERREFLRRRLAPALAGPLALAACVPLYLGQRAVLGTRTWIDPLSVDQVTSFFETLLGWPTLVATLLAWAIARRIPFLRASSSWNDQARERPWTIPESALLALCGQFAILILVSAILQPVGLDRYGIPILLAWAPLVAMATEELGPRLRGLMIAALLAGSLFAVRDQAHELRRWEGQLAEDAAILGRYRHSGTPIVAKDRHSVYPLAHRADLADLTIRYLVPSESDLRRAFPGPDSASPEFRMAEVEAIGARIHHQLFGFPALIDPETLRAGGTFVLVGADDPRNFIQRWFPTYSRNPLSDRILELRPPDAR